MGIHLQEDDSRLALDIKLIKNIKKMKLLKILILIIILQVSIFSQRIVTLAPGLTEIVFSLGKGKNIIGNTKFCNFPEKAKKIRKIGGYLDLNLEVLIDLKPDIIILYPEHYNKIKILKDKAELLIVKHETLNDIFNSIRLISEKLKKIEKGKLITSKIKKALMNIKLKTLKKKKFKTLLIAGRNPDQLTNITIIGKTDFLNEILEISGGINAYNGDIPYPNISLESIVYMNPDFIIEFSYFYTDKKRKEILNLWSKHDIITAVNKERIKIVKETFLLIPGPRVGEIAKKLYNFFYD